MLSIYVISESRLPMHVYNGRNISEAESKLFSSLKYCRLLKGRTPLVRYEVTVSPPCARIVIGGFLKSMDLS